MTWVGTIKMNENTIDNIRSVCTEIEAKDKSFHWKIENNHLLITHENKDILWKKIVWLVNKVEGLKGNKFKVKWSG